MSARPIADAAARPGSSWVVALPNLLSLLRIGLVPVIVVVLFWSGPLARAVAAALFLVACITDFLDGWLARRHGITTLGQFLDPLADKLIVAAALIMLAAVDPEPRVPAWMAVVIVGPRDRGDGPARRGRAATASSSPPRSSASTR